MMEQDKMENDLPEENRDDSEDLSSDWDNRILCSDGNCIGVIGSDGRCKECGKEYEGSLPEMSPSDIETRSVTDDIETPSVTEPEEPPSAASDVDEAEEAPKPLDPDDEWENRVLCSDGNCIGVIGPDGKCKECGKPLK